MSKVWSLTTPSPHGVLICLLPTHLLTLPSHHFTVLLTPFQQPGQGFTDITGSRARGRHHQGTHQLAIIFSSKERTSVFSTHTPTTLPVTLPSSPHPAGAVCCTSLETFHEEMTNDYGYFEKGGCTGHREYEDGTFNRGSNDVDSVYKASSGDRRSSTRVLHHNTVQESFPFPETPP